MIHRTFYLIVWNVFSHMQAVQINVPKALLSILRQLQRKPPFKKPFSILSIG